MKVLFVYPNISRAVSPQVGLTSLAAVARDAGCDCRMFDITVIPAGNERGAFVQTVQDYKPDIIGISCRSNEWPIVKQLLAEPITSNILKIVGGVHATVAPEEVIAEVDILARGEAEETFAEILQRLFKPDKYNDIPGTWTRVDGNIYKNPMRPLISNLDSVPIPYWPIFDDIHYKQSYIKSIFPDAKVTGTFEMSRGCPFGCTYCANAYIKTLYKGEGRWRREKSVDRIIKEILAFRSHYGLDCIYFIDEVVLTNSARIREFSEQYKSKIGVPFVFMERPENMTEEKTSLIRVAGAASVSIGIESGDQDLRKKLLNRKQDQESIVNAFHTARKHGLHTYAFTMVGFPGEGAGSMAKTFGLVKQAQPDTVQTTIFQPLIGTELYNKVIKEGLYDQSQTMPKDYYTQSTLSFAASQKAMIKRAQYLLPTAYSLSWFGPRLFIACICFPFAFRMFKMLRTFIVVKKIYGFSSAIKESLKEFIKTI